MCVSLCDVLQVPRTSWEVFYKNMKLNLNLIKPPNPPTSLKKILEVEKLVKQH